MDPLKTLTYAFDLPERLIAAEPLKNRDEARMLIVNKRSRTLEHRHVRDLPDILDSGYAVVANNTEVIRARLLGERVGTGGKVEFFLLKQMGPALWKGLMKTGARVLPGFRFTIPNPNGSTLHAEVLAREETPGEVLLTAKFSQDPVEAEVGVVPLPPYIMAKRGSLHSDEFKTYNTVFSKFKGSVAAPTAGRHFTPNLIARLMDRGVSWEELTLHVGLGTFKPVSVSDLGEHQMHSESVLIPKEVADRLNQAKKAGKKILAVGTTSTRALEGRAVQKDADFEILHGESEVNLFIHPGAGYTWKFIDALLTNFHLPGSTLLMMVASFIGDLGFTLQVYQTAIEHDYRFYSYGDAMLILDR